jgi:hypothetical protein
MKAQKTTDNDRVVDFYNSANAYCGSLTLTEAIRNLSSYYIDRDDLRKRLMKGSTVRSTAYAYRRDMSIR